jgi:hypothetical protein
LKTYILPVSGKVILLVPLAMHFFKLSLQIASELLSRLLGFTLFNPDVIMEKQMKASLPTSTRGTFPLTQHSPVRAVLKAMTN